jgi:hypothetical protein
MWSRSWGPGVGLGVAMDDSGNIYVTGKFHDEVDFDPGPDTRLERSSGATFLSKFDPKGEFVWVLNWDADQGCQLEVNHSGEVYITGSFSRTVDFDPGDAEDIHPQTDQIYLSKFDPFGQLEWTRTWTGDTMSWNTSIDIDSMNNVFVNGVFTGVLYFDPSVSNGGIASHGGKDIFLAKFNSNGTLTWTKTWGGVGNDFSWAVNTDSNDNVYITGYFEGTVDFDSSVANLEYSATGKDIFLVKYDQTGSLIWCKSWGGSQDDLSNFVCFDGDNAIYVTGSFCGKVDFDPGDGRDWHYSNGYNDSFISKFDLNGNFKWARSWGGYNLTIPF